MTKEKGHKSISINKFLTGKTSLGSTINKTAHLFNQVSQKAPKTHQEQ